MKVPVYSTKVINRLLGGIAITFAGGIGCYSIRSWLSGYHFKMSNASQYTYSGRTSCISRNNGSCTTGIENQESQTVKAVAEILNLQEEDITPNENNTQKTSLKSTTMHPPEEASSIKEEESFIPSELGGECESILQSEQFPRRPPRLQRQTSPFLLLDIFPYVYSTEFDIRPSNPDDQYEGLNSSYFSENSNTVEDEDSDTMCLSESLKFYLQQYMFSEAK